MNRAFPKFGYNPVTGEWNGSLKADYFWSSVNVSEAVPDVMTPSTWSLLWIYFFQIHAVDVPGEILAKYYHQHWLDAAFPPSCHHRGAS